MPGPGRLTLCDRKEISLGLHAGEAFCVIAARLGKSTSTVSREVAGNGGPLAEVGGMFQAVYQSVRPAGLRLGLTTEADGQAFLAEIADAVREGRGVGMSPLLVSAWKRKPREPDTRPALQ